MSEEHFLTAHVSRDGKVVGIEHPTDAEFADVHAAHLVLRSYINRRLRNRAKCPFHPKDQSS
jgi:hypothetical protein